MLTFLDAGDYPETEAAIAQAFYAARWPWHRLMAGGNPAGLTVDLHEPAGQNWAGVAYPWGQVDLVLYGSPADQAWTFLHEAAHIIDMRVLTPEIRAGLIALMGLPAGTNWNRTQADYLQRPREVFAITLARAIRPAAWPDPGPIAPGALPLDEADALAASLALPVDPWTDLAGLSPETVAAIRRLADFGISIGTGPGQWSPLAEVPRWQMALFLTRALDVMEAQR